MKMNSQPNYTELEALVKEGKFNEAKQLVKTAITSGQDLEFWKTQLAYVSFLNEQDGEDYYVNAPSVLAELVEANPENANSHFWLGYVTYICFGRLEIAKNHITRAKEIQPELFYADLVLAGFPDNKVEGLTLLLKVIQEKPNLHRGLIDVARIYIKMGQHDQARDMLNRLLNSEPYVEKNYGVMNEYVNGVFTCANVQETTKRDAESEIKLLDSTK